LIGFNDMTPRVFIVQEPLRRSASGEVVPRIDYRTLAPYGDVKFLFAWGDLRDDESLENPAAFLWRLRTLLRTYTSDDYLVLLGNPALTAMATLIAAEQNNGRVRLLDWIRDERQYRIVDIDIHCQPVAPSAP
jgi:hypothetical protein